MKRIIICLILLTSLFNLSVAQSDTVLEFSYDTVQYEPLNHDSSTLLTTTPWEQFDYSFIDIGFDFEWFGKEYNELRVNYDGTIWLERCLSEASDRFEDLGSFIDSANANSDSTSQSPVKYNLSGSQGNKILTVEYNMNATYNSVDDTVHYQYKLYEADNSISLQFGDIKTQNWNRLFADSTDNDSGFIYTPFLMFIYKVHCSNNYHDSIAMVYEDTINNRYVDTTGIIWFQGDISDLRLFNPPPKGTIFYFKQDFPLNSNQYQTKSELTVFPNPAHSRVNIKGAKQNTEFTIKNMLGQTLKRGKILSEKHQIDVSNLADGHYIIKTRDKTEKFIIQH
ncbi:T9SS type A sorting domain-containing protein [Salibacter sp.]|uniref:T9SS type A sorting domain-containing protein n=1 Tax=Salibacter sp. TaxID=2010995 RepID=UPI00287069B7|nr:T9SS type A sorting domain-containing protein [Salibacter sp.]MDR9488670.1 T9SS type A sorting domain-containing protein [Salibacter sp.]